MNSKKETPTDTAKLIEWVRTYKKASLVGLSDSLKNEEYVDAAVFRATLSVLNLMSDTLKTGELSIASSPCEKAPLQVLAEIWDKWGGQLVESQIIGRRVTSERVFESLADQFVNHFDKHGFAVYLALAVHMEIDGTVGSNEALTSNCSVVMAKDGNLFPIHEPNFLPLHLVYSNGADAQRACELLQCVADPLFFNFKDATPKQGG